MKAPAVPTEGPLLRGAAVLPASGLAGLGGIRRSFRALLDVASAGHEEHAPQGEDPPAEVRPDRPQRVRESPSQSAPEPVRVEPVAPSTAAEPVAPVTGRQPAPAEPPPLQQLVQQLVREVSVCQLGSQTSLRLQLSTPGIRRLGLDLRIDGGRLTARFSVPDLKNREMLRSAAQQLEASLGARGIALETIEVEVEQAPPTSSSAASFRSAPQGREDPSSGDRHAGGGQQRRREARPKDASPRGKGYVA